MKSPRWWAHRLGILRSPSADLLGVPFGKPRTPVFDWGGEMTAAFERGRAVVPPPAVLDDDAEFGGPMTEAEPCRYERRWTDEVGTIDVCVVHGNNSRHDWVGPNRPCLSVDPYPPGDPGFDGDPDELGRKMLAVLMVPDSIDADVPRTEAGYPSCATCDGGGCPDCTDPA